MDEFGLIRRYFAPLAGGFSGSLHLGDDAALIEPPPGQQLVITKDAISAGIHFPHDEDPQRIAQKLLRVNLSDLAAMGATPLCYFLALMLPKATDEGWFARFAEGLAIDQKYYGIHLAGGDTTATQGTLSLSLTALGSLPKGQALRRSGAKEQDSIYVSGTLGDSALGLAALKEKVPNAYLIDRYQLPQPRLALGQALRNIASACMDISDGLLQDMEHLCTASNLGASIQRAHLPLSAAAQQAVERDDTAWEKIIAGGDDYELLFTAPQLYDTALQQLAKELQLNITKIGHMTAQLGVQLLDAQGRAIHVSCRGFKHF